MRFDQLARDVEPQPQPTVVSPGDRPLEALEDPRLVLLERMHLHQHVGNGNQRPHLLDLQLDWLAGAKLHRVGQQVGDRLLDPHRVPVADHGIVREPNAQGALRLAKLSLEPRRQLLNQEVQVHRLSLQVEGAPHDSRHIEQAVDQPAQPLNLSKGGLQLGGKQVSDRSGSLLLHRLEQSAEVELEGGERRAQLVTGDREELVSHPQRLLEVGGE